MLPPPTPPSSRPAPPSRPCHAALFAAAAALALTAAAQADFFSPQSASATKLATVSSTINGISGYDHCEGPIFDGQGDILFCELNSNDNNSVFNTHDLIWSFNIAQGAVSGNPSIAVANSGGTQGDYFNAAGQLITTDRDTRQISVRSVSALSTATLLANSWNGHPFYGPNDLVIDSHNGIYFTDPDFFGGSRTGSGFDAVYYISSGTVSQARTYGTNTNGSRPNGIELSPDGSTLYVGLWGANAIMAYTVAADGSLSADRTFIASVAHPDGMTIDPWGDLIVSRTGGVTCFSPAGLSLWSVSTADSGADNAEIYNNTLYITAGLSLYSVGLTPVPEPASLAILAAALPLLIRRRRRQSCTL